MYVCGQFVIIGQICRRSLLQADCDPFSTWSAGPQMINSVLSRRHTARLSCCVNIGKYFFPPESATAERMCGHVTQGNTDWFGLVWLWQRKPPCCEVQQLFPACRGRYYTTLPNTRAVNQTIFMLLITLVQKKGFICCIENAVHCNLICLTVLSQAHLFAELEMVLVNRANFH